MYDHCNSYDVGTTTVELTTTVPPSPVQTITSGGYAIVVMDTGSYVQSVGATQVQVVSKASSPTRINGAGVWISGLLVFTIGMLMVGL
jgi:hypothetical protein